MSVGCGRSTSILASVHEGKSARVSSGLGILLADPTQRRLVEDAALQLGLRVTVLERAGVELDRFAGFEVILADEPVAWEIRAALGNRDWSREGLHPAVIGVSTDESTESLREASLGAAERTDFALNGILFLPMPAGALAAQLSSIVYCHRVFAQRCRSAFEELHLNHLIFESVTSGISVSDATRPDLPLVYVNPAFEAMTGYGLEEVRGRNCRFLQGSMSDQAAVTAIRVALREERGTIALLKNFRKDGSAFWNELSLSPIRNLHGDLTHVVGIQTDVTARVEFEAALRESEKLAAVGRLASSIAHEINNPLESVTNLLYLAGTAEERSDTMRYVAMADRELRRVAQITSQSLRFYKQSTRPQEMRCVEMFDAVLDLYEGRAENSEVRVERRDRSTSSVVCLESEIRQVLNNLVRNAIDAMHGRGGRLLVRSREATDWKTLARGVRMTIADSGTGMSAGTRHDLFKPFFTTKGLAGTGLGLWISAEIVSRHRGELRVRSCQGPKCAEPYSRCSCRCRV